MSEKPNSPSDSKAAVLKAKAMAQVGNQVEKLKGAKDSALQLARGPVKILGKLAKSIGSPDVETRRMAWLFLFAVFGVVFVLLFGAIRFVHSKRGLLKQHSEAQAENLTRFVEKQKAAAEAKHTILCLGAFGIALNDVPNSKKLPGVVNMAEIEVTVQCSTTATCDYLEKNLIRAKDIVTLALVPQDREDLMSNDGKERLKAAIQQRLNIWLTQGEIKKVYFSRMIID